MVILLEAKEMAVNVKFGETVQKRLTSQPTCVLCFRVAPRARRYQYDSYKTNLKEKNKMEAKENINIVLIASTSIREKEFQGLPVV
jgi:hypothetical protein